ncbi:hypothetical protein L2D14_03245 [Thalassospiraceae bacterium LMO-JJ14]|nr:hypothetical protein L2D14_03245 [Thalassospiraceae bacterium LMO-JJ14]
MTNKENGWVNQAIDDASKTIEGWSVGKRTAMERALLTAGYVQRDQNRIDISGNNKKVLSEA